MKKLKLTFIVALLFFGNSFAAALTPTDYVKLCKDRTPDSPCYSYFQGVIDTIGLYAKGPCYNVSDREIFNVAVNAVIDFVKEHPGVEIFYPADIIRDALYKRFPCVEVQNKTHPSLLREDIF